MERNPKGVLDQFIAFDDSSDEDHNKTKNGKSSNKESTSSNTTKVQSNPIRNTNKKYPIWVPEEKKKNKFAYEGTIEEQLTEELKDFCEYMKPTKSEKKMRNDVRNRFENLVYTRWNRAEVYLFGSSDTKLSLACSDMDFVVMGGKGKRPLYVLADVIRENKMASKIQLITNAKVPIIKMTDAVSGCEMDISFDMIGGPENTRAMKVLMKKYPQSIPLCLFLKYYLKQATLNEPFSGGVGSYALLSMVISFIQNRNEINKASKISKKSKYYVDEKSNNKNNEETEIGKLLIDFFKFYGTKFNYYIAGISLTNGGSYFSKVKRTWLDEKKPFKLSVEDPHDETNDVGRSTFMMYEVRELFNKAYHKLIEENPLEQSHDMTVLNRLVGNDLGLIERRKRIEKLYPIKSKDEESSQSESDSAQFNFIESQDSSFEREYNDFYDHEDYKGYDKYRRYDRDNDRNDHRNDNFRSKNNYNNNNGGGNRNYNNNNKHSGRNNNNYNNYGQNNYNDNKRKRNDNYDNKREYKNNQNYKNNNGGGRYNNNNNAFFERSFPRNK